LVELLVKVKNLVCHAGTVIRRDLEHASGYHIVMGIVGNAITLNLSKISRASNLELCGTASLCVSHTICKTNAHPFRNVLSGSETTLVLFGHEYGFVVIVVEKD
jgi:hypothetical protein